MTNAYEQHRMHWFFCKVESRYNGIRTKKNNQLTMSLRFQYGKFFFLLEQKLQREN